MDETVPWFLLRPRSWHNGTMRILCLIIGYAFGCILAADIVARVKTGRPVRELGTGNPGMANVTKELGAACGAIVLVCDIAKVAVPYLICRFVITPLFGGAEGLFACPDASGDGDLCALWVGLGATLGHNFPFWLRCRGGKGVTTTCATIILFCPTWGWLVLAIGLVIMLLTRQLSVGAVVITVAFLPLAWLLGGAEGLALAAVLLVLMLIANGKTLRAVAQGTQQKTDPRQNLRNLTRKSPR